MAELYPSILSSGPRLVRPWDTTQGALETLLRREGEGEELPTALNDREKILSSQLSKVA